MQTLADRLGISKMTVSRALNNDKRISPSTREKVLRLAQEMGYHKSPLVSALMTQIRSGVNQEKTLVLAHVHNWTSARPLTRNLAIFRKAVRDRAMELGLSINLISLEKEEYRLARVLQIIESRGIRGVIIEHLLERPIVLEESLDNFSLVSIGQSVVSPILHSVDGDPHLEILELMDDLRRRGYQRPALVNTEYSEQMNTFRRRAGFLIAQSQLPTADHIPPLYGCLKRSDLIEALPEFIRQHKPDVILSQHSSVYDFLLESGFRIPEDIGFAHLGWHPGDDRFAGIDTNWQARGITAVNLIVDLLNRNEFGIPKLPIRSIVPTSIINGQSLRYE